MRESDSRSVTKDHRVRKSERGISREETVVGFLSALESLARPKQVVKFRVSYVETKVWWFSWWGVSSSAPGPEAQTFWFGREVSNFGLIDQATPSADGSRSSRYISSRYLIVSAVDRGPTTQIRGGSQGEQPFQCYRLGTREPMRRRMT